MARPPKVPALTDPKLFDSALLEIQGKLVASLPWLDYAYGKAQRMVKDNNGRAEYYPGVYIGGADHASVFPNDQIGNFSFFDVDRKQPIDSLDRQGYNVEADVGLVFWFDFRKVYPDDFEARSLDNVRFDVLEVFRTMILRKSQFKITGTAEEAVDIYPRYRDKEIDTQFLMRPFGGFRLNLFLRLSSSLNC